VLRDGIRRLLAADPVDQHIALAIRTIDAYEEFSIVFTGAFNLTLWALRNAGGTASPQRLLATGPMCKALESWRRRLVGLLPRLREILPLIAQCGAFREQQAPALMTNACDDTESGLGSAENLLNALLSRHERV
jgi:hypothetical protein